MDYYINNIQKHISTVNMFDNIISKISNYKRNNIYTTEMHSILKIHAGHCKYKHINHKPIDDDAFYNIISTINDLCTCYHINYEILGKIFNMIGVYSAYYELGTVDYILECMLIHNNDCEYELNYNLLYDPEFKLFLEFYRDMYNSSYDEKIDILTEYFYHTDLRNSFIQAYAVRLAEKMHKDYK